ncbi:MAG TPA: hypothetical protein VFX70_07815 [Mycobacteriales bacterium]|nr:hypothetical protein [Mycobacteriales bacterium]
MPPTPDEVSLLAGIRPAPRIRRLTGDWSYATWNDTATLPEDAQDRLAGRLGAIATEAFGTDRTENWRGLPARGYFRQITRFCLIIDPGHEVVGLVSQRRERLAGARCLYLDAAAVLPSAQRAGLVGRLLVATVTREYLRRFAAPIYLLARTGNPAVYRGLRNTCGPANTWPAPNGSPPPAPVSAIAAAAARWLGQADRFDPRTFAIRGAYHTLYQDSPQCGEADLDALFGRSLCPDDALLVVARVRLSVALATWFGLLRRGIRSTRRRAADDRSPASTAG